MMQKSKQHILPVDQGRGVIILQTQKTQTITHFPLLFTRSRKAPGDITAAVLLWEITVDTLYVFSRTQFPCYSLLFWAPSLKSKPSCLKFNHISRMRERISRQYPEKHWELKLGYFRIYLVKKA